MTVTVRHSCGLELNVLESLKNRDLEKIDQVLNDDCSFRQLPKQLCSCRRSADPAYGPVYEITCIEKSNGWTVGEILPKEQRWGRS